VLALAVPVHPKLNYAYSYIKEINMATRSKKSKKGAPLLEVLSVPIGYMKVTVEGTVPLMVHRVANSSKQ